MDPDPARRPTAKELYAYLRGIVASRIAPPEVIMARLATPMRVRGMDARVEWEITNVSEVTIRVGASAPMTVPVTANGGPQLHAFPAPRIRPGDARGREPLRCRPRRPGRADALRDPALRPEELHRHAAETGGAAARGLHAGRTRPRACDRAPGDGPRASPAAHDTTADLTGVLRETLLPLGTGQLPQVRGIGPSLRFPDFGGLVAGPTRETAEQLTSQARELAKSQRKSHLKALADAEEDD